MRRLLGVSLVFAGCLTAFAPVAPAEAAPPRPPASHPHHYHVYKVQVRHPNWHNFGITPTHASGEAQGRALRRAGWYTQVRHYRGTTHLVRGKMTRWHTVATVGSPAVANGVMRNAMARGFQSRVLTYTR
jgi:hypothetical protein